MSSKQCAQRYFPGLGIDLLHKTALLFCEKIFWIIVMDKEKGYTKFIVCSSRAINPHTIRIMPCFLTFS